MEKRQCYKEGGRRTASMTELGTGTPLVDNIISMLPSRNDKALKYSFYNVIAALSAVALVVSLWVVYCILEPFIKSLLWSLLCGTVLYPFKSRIVSFLRNWMSHVKDSEIPFTVYVVGSPLIIADALSERLGNFIVVNWKYIVFGFSTFFATHLLYHNPPVTIGYLLTKIATNLYSISYSFLSWVRLEVVLALAVIYTLCGLKAVVSFRRMKSSKLEGTNIISPKEASTDVIDTSVSNEPSDQSSIKYEGLLLRMVSVLTWGMGFLYMCRSLPFSILIPFALSMCAGSLTYFRQRATTSHYSVAQISKLATRLALSIGRGHRNKSIMRSQSIEAMNLSFLSGLITPKTETESQSSSSPASTNTFESDEVDYGLLDSKMFLYTVFLACVIVQVWRHLWLTHLIPLPFVYYGIKKFLVWLKFGKFIRENALEPLKHFYHDNQNELSGDIFPLPVRLLVRVAYYADKKLCDVCENYLDPVVSTFILIFMLLSVTLLFMFAATQFYSEGDHIVRVGVDFINRTVAQNPDIHKILPEKWETMMGSMVDNAYVYGKDYITNLIKDSVANRDSDKALEIEKQVIDLWDKIYLSWNQTWSGNSTKITHVQSSKPFKWDELIETGKSVPIMFEYTVVVKYAKENLGTLLALMDSIWNILVGNISVAASLVTSLASVLLGGGTAIVNLIINLAVFFTALFYLLSSSKKAYKPVEIFKANIPGDGRHSSMFFTAVEDAINGVFSASFKMAAFYGMWTWLIHSLFQIKIVFIPSFLAAIFGAIPLLMPYWACFPAVLELGIQGNWTWAILMFAAQMAPMSLVDTQIYSEIKGGGHPYLTGLAVAGGIFYFGIQGAIMGPVILCCVVVAVKMGSAFLRDQELHNCAET